MYVSGGQSYKKVVQFALRDEKITNERMSRGNFQKRKGFNFMSKQSSKNSQSSDSSRSRTDLFVLHRQNDHHNRLGLVRYYRVS